jgi:mycoredoxin
MPEVSTQSTQQLFTMYSTEWCGSCKRLKYYFDTLGLKAGKDYQEINIDENEEAAELVEKINDGYRSVPTLVFKDNTTLTEPTDLEVSSKLSKF